MRLSKGRKKELECITYFIPRFVKWDKITEEDIKKYFEWSDEGKHKDIIKSHWEFPHDGFTALRQGKRWRAIHAKEMYEGGILDGSIPYSVLLEGFPKCVMEYLSKEMFQGHDKELIEEVWREINGIL